MSKHLRAAAAVFAAVSVIAATGVVGVASAATAPQTRSAEVQNPRLPVSGGATITEVKVSGTSGPAGGSINTWSGCEEFADAANELIAEGLDALYDKGNMAVAGEKFGAAVKVLNEGESVGCTFA